MKRTTSQVLAFVAVLAVSAAACGDSSDDSAATTVAAPATAATTAQSPPASDDPGAELRAWGWASSETEDSTLTGLLGEYSSISGDSVTFEPQPEYDTALQAALSAGDPPDFFYVDSFKLPDLAAAGALAPIPDGVITDPGDIYPSLQSAFTFDGTWYCPPKDFSTLGLVYDVDALAEAGIEPPTTMEELAVAAAALTTPDRKGLVFGPELARAGVFMLGNGGYIVNDDVSAMTLDSDANRAALQYLADMFQAGNASTPSAIEAGWAGEALGQGKAAMVIEGNWIVGFLADNFPDRNWDVVEMPAGTEGRGTFAFTVCYGVGAEHESDAAWDAVDYLTGPEGAAKWTDAFNVMPARQSLRDGWLSGHEKLEPFLNGAEYAHAWQFTPGFGDVVGEFNTQFEQLIAGDITVDQLIASVTEAGESVLG
ncbi:MAG: multiple sugar transport system substrate-binding protein [Acidimicrobiaceae bacterium]|nr:MAG: multiple sugar transport system substrate-binding protein [Acidimicrobiaceae bacterium]